MDPLYACHLLEEWLWLVQAPTKYSLPASADNGCWRFLSSFHPALMSIGPHYEWPPVFDTDCTKVIRHEASPLASTRTLQNGKLAVIYVGDCVAPQMAGFHRELVRCRLNEWRECLWSIHDRPFDQSSSSAYFTITDHRSTSEERQFVLHDLSFSSRC